MKESHEIRLHPVSRIRVVVPQHPGDLPEGPVRAIVRQMKLTVEDFLAL